MDIARAVKWKQVANDERYEMEKNEGKREQMNKNNVEKSEYPFNFF